MNKLPASEEEYASRVVRYWTTALGKAEQAAREAETKMQQATLSACKATAFAAHASAALLKASQSAPHDQAERQALSEWRRQHSRPDARP